MHLIVMEITLLITENNGKIMFLNFCGNPVLVAEYNHDYRMSNSAS